MIEDNKIRQQFQSKLGNYRASVPEDGWQRLEQSLAAAKTAKIVRRRWYAGAAAAAAALLIGSLLFLQNPMRQSTPVAETSVSGEVLFPHSGDFMADNAPAIEKPSAKPANKLHRAISQKSGRAEERVSPSANHSSDVPASWFKKERASGKSERKSIPSQSRNAGGERDEARSSPVVVSSDYEQQEPLFAEHVPSSRSRKKLSLAFNGKGALTSVEKTVNAPMTLRSASVAADDEPGKMFMNPAMSAAENVSEMEHNLPISVGITVSKSFSDNLSVETGLVYSYLYSKVRNTNPNITDKETQHLHYLGVPLNVNYKLFSVRNLDVYASVGGMAEKDVYGEYRKDMQGRVPVLESAVQETEVTRIRQKNLQFSVNAGVGASYPLINDLKLYGKIGGAYYFDAGNEHKSIYSDRKIVMDLNVGLRYEF